MKTIKILLICLLLLFSAAVQAISIAASHSGSWYNPDQPGHGLNIEVLSSDTLVIYWNTSHPDGTPMWLISVAGIDGDTATGDAYYVSGMRFGIFDPTESTEQHWGQLSIRFEDCDNAHLSYQSPLSHGGFIFGMGEIDFVRLTSIDSLDCTSLPPGKFGNYSTGLEIPPYTGWPINSFAWILRDGTLAYQLASNGEVLEIGYGQLTMTDEDAFEFEARTIDGIQGETSHGQRQGTGRFDGAQVTLNLGELGVLSEPLDPDFDYPVTFTEIAGKYAGPDAIWIATLDTAGEYSGMSIGGEFSGTLSIPEPGFNQLVNSAEYIEGDVNFSVGVYHRATGFLLFISGWDDRVWTMPWFHADW